MNADVAPSPILLQYDVAPAIDKGARRRCWIKIFAAFVGMLVTVSPFTYDISPAKALIELTPKLLSSFDPIWLLAAPFFLAYPIFLWNVLRLLNCRVRTFERAAFGALGFAGFAIVGSSIFFLSHDNPERDWIIAAASAVPLVLGSVVIVTFFIRRCGRDERVLAAMTGPYLANLVLCLIGFAGHGQMGWYAAFIPAAITLAELIALTCLAIRGGKSTVMPAVAGV